MDLSTNPDAGMARREPLAGDRPCGCRCSTNCPTPTVCARLAAEAEEAGWHGFFVWDQLRWERAGAPSCRRVDHARHDRRTATERLRLGPMVTPLPRRRPVKVAHETATLDWLSGGRLTLGVGIGGDRSLASSRRPASSSTNGPTARCSTRHWRSSPPPGAVSRFTTTATTTRSTTSQFLPRPVQRPDIPVWITRYQGNVKPMRRAALLRRVLSRQSRAPRSTRRGRCRRRRAPRRHDGPVRHRRRPPRRRRSRAVRRGRCHVVAPGVRPRGAVVGRRAGPSPPRTLRTVSTDPFDPTDFYDAELRWYDPHFDAAAAECVRPIMCSTSDAGQVRPHVTDRPAAVNGDAVGVDISASRARARPPAQRTQRGHATSPTKSRAPRHTRSRNAIRPLHQSVRNDVLHRRRRRVHQHRAGLAPRCSSRPPRLAARWNRRVVHRHPPGPRGFGPRPRRPSTTWNRSPSPTRLTPNAS